jgi:hypothetical protein
MKKQASTIHKRLPITVLALVLTTAWAYAQTGEQPQAGTTALQGTFPAVLSKSLDSKKLKVGDEVIGQTAGPLQDQSGKEIPRGSKVVGHVTQAQARSKGDAQSSLAMVFDKIEVAHGGEAIPIKGVLQAVAPGAVIQGAQGGGFPPDIGPGSAPGSSGGAPNLGTGPGGSFPSGPLGRSGGGAPTNGPSQQQPGATTGVAPTLSTATKGVVGIHNLEMDNNSVLTSSGKQVKLDSGTQLMIRAE